MNEICAGDITQFPVGSVTTLQQGHLTIALFHRPEGWFAIKNTCPHADLPLCRGSVAGTVVTCPGHGWQFELATGACVAGGDPTVSARIFPVTIREGQIWIQVG